MHNAYSHVKFERLGQYAGCDVYGCSTLTVSSTRSLPVANAIAIGGVATGNMKEKDVDMVTGNIRKSGLFPSVFACNDM